MYMSAHVYVFVVVEIYLYITHYETYNVVIIVVIGFINRRQFAVAHATARRRFNITKEVESVEEDILYALLLLLLCFLYLCFCFHCD